jgi:hypothetical protein
VRWFLQWGTRWLAQQAWRGIRQRPTEGTSASEPGDAVKEERLASAFAVVCSSRQLLENFTDAMAQKRVLEGDGFRVVSGKLAGAPIVVAVRLRPSTTADQMVSAILHGHRPNFLVSVGEGTSCRDTLREGEIVVATTLTGPDGARLDLDGRVPASAWIHHGRIAAVAGLSQDTLAVDTWSWENALACRSLDLPLLSITAITRPCPAQQSAAIEALRQPSNLARRTGALASVVWNRPQELKRVWSLQSATWQVCERAVKLVAMMAESTKQP